MFNLTLSDLIKVIESYQECCGVLLPDKQSSSSIIKHTISKKFDFMKYKRSSNTLCSQTFMLCSKMCDVLLIEPGTESPACKACNKLKVQTVGQDNRKKKLECLPAKLNAPIKFTSPERLKVYIAYFVLC